MRRNIADLERKGLIQRLRGEYNHSARPCRLTLSGIVYLILIRRLLFGNTFQKIVENYGNNTLFRIFLYTNISRGTLSQLASINLITPVSLFLYEVCEQIVHTLAIINTAKTKYPTEHVFVWEIGPLNEYAKNSLRDFLKRKYNLTWIDRAELGEIERNNTLIISHKANTILIKLDSSLGKAILKVRGKETYQFVARPFSSSSYLIEAPSSITHVKMVQIHCSQRFKILFHHLYSV